MLNKTTALNPKHRHLQEHPEIKGLFFGTPSTPAHIDNRRTLGSIFNGDFSAAQAKYLQFHETCVAGGHSHNYKELTFMVTGTHRFEFVDLRDGANKNVISLELHPGEMLLVPANIAHRGFHPAGSFILAFTEQPYRSAAENDIPYKFT